ncbi:hypothetical protein BGZ98_008982 [Dissophora globulifera]|nr:hypothetical protein BGZ98_008982 [Dissophora globulifera]
MRFSRPANCWLQERFSILKLVALGCALVLTLLPATTTAWPYVDCSGASPVFGLSTVTAHFDPADKVVDLALTGDFSNLNQYPATETSQWRASIVTTRSGAQLHRSEGPACILIAGGCPTAPGPSSISTNFTVAQTAPFAELVVSLQIVSATNQSIVCVAILLEQSMAEVNTAVSYLPLALAVYSGFISLVSMVMRASVNNGFLSAVATYGLATTSEVINVHTPGLFDVIFYAQFMVMTGQLSLNYPSFYVTFTSLFHWSFLEFRNSFAGKGPDNSTYVLTYGGAGSVNQIRGAQNAAGDSKLKKRMDPVPWDIAFATAPFTPTKQEIPMPTLFQANAGDRAKHMKRQNPLTSPSTSPSSSVPSSPSITPDPTSTTDTSSSSISLSLSTVSKTKTKPITTQTTTSAAPASTTTPALIIPIITDPFNNNKWASRQYNVSRFGMESYAAAIGAFPSTLFLGTLINTVLAGGVSLFLSAFCLIGVWFFAGESHQKGNTVHHALNFVTAVLTWRILHASSRLLLFEDLGTLLNYGPLYNTLSEGGTLFFLVNLLARFLWGVSISMLSAYGTAQVAVLLAVELGYVIVIGVKWPFAESSDNKFHLLLGFVRVIVTGCSVAYIHTLNTSPEIRQLIGYIQMALHLVVFLVMLAIILWNTIQLVLFWRSRHTIAWRNPTKNYSFGGTVEGEHGWAPTGRPLSRRPPALPETGLVDSRSSQRYTVEPYSSVTDLRSNTDDEIMTHRSLYRHTLQPSGYRRSRMASNDLTLDLRPETIVPLTNSAGGMSAGSISPHPHSASLESLDGLAIPLQPTQLSSTRAQPPKESYAKFQRMTHQQTTQDLRNRRMSEIFRDGGYLYDPSQEVGSSEALAEEKPSAWGSMKGALGGLFSLRKRSVRKPTGDGSKPKAFEVIRPSRAAPVHMDTIEHIPQPGDVRELNSLGISRFFQESGRNNIQNRSLFVANPETMVSRTASVRSSMSGNPLAPPHLNRTASAATSINTMGYRPRAQRNFSMDLASMVSGIGPSTTEQDNADSRRESVLSSTQESNIAEALRSETPMKLQGGGILKVSKGPEKAVQYWHRESGQYVGSSVDLTLERRQTPTRLPSPPLLLFPARNSPVFDTAYGDATSPKATYPLQSFAGSRPDSPTESHQSNANVAASAGRMHEILDRMFSDQDDDESDTMSEGEESVSTFSDRVSATIMALHQRQEDFADAQSMYRPDVLMPVLEYYDPGQEDPQVEGSGVGGDVRPENRRAHSGSGRPRANIPLLRATSGPALGPSRSGNLGRPFAQTSLHASSALPFSGTISRQPSYSSLRDASVAGPSIAQVQEPSFETMTASSSAGSSAPQASTVTLGSTAVMSNDDKSLGTMEVLDQ